MSRDRFAPAVRRAADRYGIRPELLDAVVQAESNYNPAAISPFGAIGLTQLMPATAKELGVDPEDPHQAIDGGARYLAQLLKSFGSEELALAAYNAGMGNVRKYNGIPPFPETENYVSKVLELAGPSGAAWMPGRGEDVPLPPPVNVPPQVPQPAVAPPDMFAGMVQTPWTMPLLMALAAFRRRSR